jgi:hypothetical protein
LEKAVLSRFFQPISMKKNADFPPKTFGFMGQKGRGRGAAAPPWMASQKAAEQERPRATLAPWEAQNNRVVP